MLYRGIVTVNDKQKVRVEFPNGRWIEHWKGEHDPALFPVGEEVSCSNTAIFRDGSNGHTFLTVDWRDKLTKIYEVEDKLDGNQKLEKS